ncbi:hypothetical protein RND81_07G199100 [Saponaria officinalis]|uniref:BHLH domain-containing protein n=1 Tax=Saponaria officinalis TaxID=3572 RepID=A0AAW1JSU0_SAPOF
MEVSTPSAWLSELEIEDLMLFQEPYLVNSLDEIMHQNINNDFTTLHMNQDKHQRHMSLSSSTESNSNITTPPTTATKSKPAPKKQPRVQNSTSSYPVILNFGSTLLPEENDNANNVEQIMEDDEELLPNYEDDVVDEEVPPPKRKYNKRSATTSTKEHIMAERRRREKLSQRFAALSALIPGLSRMDKTSILAEAIKHLKELQEKIKYLEEQTANRSVESVTLVKKTQYAACEEDDHSSACNEYIHSASQKHEQMPEIEAKLCNKNLLIKMSFEKHDISLSRILGAVEKHHLTVSTVHASPFGDRTLDVTIIAQMEKEFDARLKDILEDVSLACRKG